MTKVRILRSISVFYLFLFAISSCGNYEQQSTISSSYFDLDSLVNEQISTLTKLKGELNKEAILGEVSESVNLKPDSLTWENELKIFRESNINKYAFIGLYSVQKKKQDEFSNLFFDEFLAENPDKSAVDKLRVYYLSSPEFLKKIEVELSDQNELFQSGQTLQMIFEDFNDKPVLKSYQIEGNQKLRLNDPVDYQVKALITF